jgi:hypothetical protein
MFETVCDEIQKKIQNQNQFKQILKRFDSKLTMTHLTKKKSANDIQSLWLKRNPIADPKVVEQKNDEISDMGLFIEKLHNDPLFSFEGPLNWERPHFYLMEGKEIVSQTVFDNVWESFMRLIAQIESESKISQPILELIRPKTL